MTRKHLSVLLATTNRGKLAELRALFGDLPVELLSLADVLPERPPVAEDGATFEENALIKARAAASDAMMITLAEDSGLEVDALGGRPGVRSARFAKDGATDAENNEALLAALEHVEDTQRQARFRCVMVLLDPWSEDEAGFGAEGAPRGARPGAPSVKTVITEGRCEGMIDREARGTGGFGYDPLFVVDGYGRTMAELAEDEKHEVSHRGRAARAMRPALEALIAHRLAEARRALGAQSRPPAPDGGGGG
ncbi:MAG: non-canonical purine NTP pyrophosphatase [Polyangiaceae bacterium]|nr:non-canonical purine NTP pyrophosphatase [Polyangiaceae bacterium]